MTAVRPSPRATRTGVWVGIATIAMSFAAYTSAMVVREGAAADWLHFRLPPILFLNSAIVLLSSVTLELSGARQARTGGLPGQQSRADLVLPPNALRWVTATLLLGMLFLAGQVVAWRQLVSQGLSLASSPSSAFFYLLTVMHALHLTGGLLALAWVRGRLRRMTGSSPAAALRGVSLYWHFMTALWLFLFVVLVFRI